MKDLLREVMQEFCKEFGIVYREGFSETLNVQQLNLYNMFFRSQIFVGNIIEKFGERYLEKDICKSISEIIEKRSNTVSSNVGIISENDLTYVKEYISTVLLLQKKLASHPELSPGNIDISLTHLSSVYDKVIRYSLVDPYFFNQIYIIEELIRTKNLTGTLPMVSKSYGVFSFFKKRNDTNVMVHECIHYLLSKMNVWFDNGEGISPLDEGICVFLHKRFDKYFSFYNKKRNDQYRYWAAYFDIVCTGVDNKRCITHILEYAALLQKDHKNMIMDMKEKLQNTYNIRNDVELQKLNNHVIMPTKPILAGELIDKYA